MNLNKLVNRVTRRETGKEEANVTQTKATIKSLHSQLLVDTQGNFDLYGLIRSIEEPYEAKSDS